MLKQLFGKSGTIGGETRPTGTLHAVKISKYRKASLEWQVRNRLTWGYFSGWMFNGMAKVFSHLTGIPTLTSTLRLVYINALGQEIDYGIVSRRVVTTAGVNFLVDDWDDDSEDITLMNFHGSGTGITAAVIGDTGVETELTTELDPNSTRTTGVKTQPSANIIQSVGTATYDGAAAVTEHGLMDQASTAGGSLWDRHVFAAINVVATDSIQFTYQCTVNSGG